MASVKIIRRLGVRSTAKVVAGIHAAFGCAIGVAFMFMALVGTAVGEVDVPGVLIFLFGIGAALFFPVLYGIMGFFTGGIVAFLYNKTVKWTGGLRLSLDDDTSSELSKDEKETN